MVGSYLPLPDEPKEEIPKTTQVHFRYHIIEAGNGLIESTSQKAHALEVAQYHADRMQGAALVYDTMAHEGAEREWKIEPKAAKP